MGDRCFHLLSLLPIERGSALADFLEPHFKTTKLLRAQFREHFLHLPGMLSKGRNNEILATRGEGNDPNASVFGALNPADEALRDEAFDSDTDRAWGQIDDWADRIDGQRPFAQQEFQYAEIREAESGLFNTSGCVPCQGAHRLHHYYPDVVRPLIASGHKNLNLPEVYSIKYIAINIHDANAMASIQSRSRDHDCSQPPPRIRTGGFPASGSCLR